MSQRGFGDYLLPASPLSEDGAAKRKPHRESNSWGAGVRDTPSPQALGPDSFGVKKG